MSSYVIPLQVLRQARGSIQRLHAGLQKLHPWSREIYMTTLQHWTNLHVLAGMQATPAPAVLQQLPSARLRSLA